MIPIANNAAQLAPSWRFPEGSTGRIAHAIVLALLNQAGLIIPIVAIAPVLLGQGDPFDAAPPAFLLLAIIAVLQAVLVVGTGLLRLGRISLSDLGWRVDHLGTDVARGVLGGAATIAIVLGTHFLQGGAAAVVDVWSAVASYSIAQRALFVGIGLIAAFAEESRREAIEAADFVAWRSLTKGAVVHFVATLVVSKTRAWFVGISRRNSRPDAGCDASLRRV